MRYIKDIINYSNYVFFIKELKTVLVQHTAPTLRWIELED
jgi:hypothetical protein